MLPWSRNVGEHTTSVDGVAESQEWRALGRELGAFWETLCREIELAGLSGSLKWIILILELSIETGQIFAYPVIRDAEPAPRRVMVSVLAPFLLKQFEALPNRKDDSEGFERAADILKLDSGTALDRGSREKGAKAALKRVRKGRQFSVLISPNGNAGKPHYFLSI